MAENNAVVQKEAAPVTSPETTRGGVFFTPRVDIFENQDELLLSCDMPGVKPEDLDLRFEKGELTLHGKVAPRRFPGNNVQFEYEVGDFYRAFTISEEVDPDKIKAELKHGILTVYLPKRDAVKPKKIAIKGE